MNKPILISLALCLAASPVFAIWGIGDITFDPSTYGAIGEFQLSEAAKWAEAIKKYEDMILGQERMLNAQSQFAARVGDWKGVVDKAKSIQMQFDQISKSYGKGYNVVAFVDYGNKGLGYTNRGQFEAINTHSAYGTEVTINDQRMKRYTAIDQLHDDILQSFDQTDARITEVEKEISTCASDIANAPSQAEADKLTSKLHGLTLVLSDLRAQRAEKIQRLLETKAVNDSQAEKEREAQAAVDDATDAESSKKFGAMKTGGQF